MAENEFDFWTELRFEITNSRLIESYCDWIEPKIYYFEMRPTTVEGRIGLLALDMEEYEFKLTIDDKLDDSNELEAINLKHWIIDENISGFNGNTIDIKLIKNKTLHNKV